jgi:hypothetical protein
MQRLTSTMSRIERVVLFSLINLFLKLMTTVAPLAWTTIIYGSTNLISMTLLHTIPSNNPGPTTRLLICIRRVSLFVFSHAVMRASLDDNDGSGNSDNPQARITTLVKGTGVLAALTLIPSSISEEDDGEQFMTQIIYAFSTNTQGILDPLRDSRVFGLIAFVYIIISPYLKQELLNIKYGARVTSTLCQASNLVFFDAFTVNVFTDSGDPFCDLAIIIGVFSTLWNFQNVSEDMQGIQQFTTWRTASFVSNILGDIHLNGFTLTTSVFVTATLLGNLLDKIPWLQDLLFLVGLNGIIQEVQAYIGTVQDEEGFPILFGFIVIIATINSSISNYTKIKPVRDTLV